MIFNKIEDLKQLKTDAVKIIAVAGAVLLLMAFGIAMVLILKAIF